MPDKVTNAEKAAEDAKEDAKWRKTPKSVKDAQKKVKGHVQDGKPGPETEHITHAPDSTPTK